VKCMSIDMIPAIVSVKMNYHYFPSMRYVRESSNTEWEVESIL
jgi:hypothetical protein